MASQSLWLVVAWIHLIIIIIQIQIAPVAAMKDNLIIMSENSNNQMEPNPPTWPNSVLVVRPEDGVENPEWMQQLLQQKGQDSWDEEHQTFTCDYHFSSRRQAILFAPGTYHWNAKFQVGYYVQVAGLGRTMDAVKFVGDNNNGPFVSALNRHLHGQQHRHGTSLDTFWRSGENFFVEHDLMWAVSQASPLRRVHVGGDLYLHDGAAYASGGHLANSIVQGKIHAGGQQQFLIRHVELQNGATGGAWSMVYAGCTGQVPEQQQQQRPNHTLGHANDSDSSQTSVTLVEKPRVRMEKPYICLQEDGIKYELRVPKALYEDNLVLGPLADGSNEHERVIDFSHVCVIQPPTDGDDSTTTHVHGDDDSFERIQQALDDENKHVVLTPGIYRLRQTLEMRHPNQVLLGLGLSTLVAPSNGAPCIHVAPHVPGVIVAGIMLEASQRDTSSTSSAVSVPFSSLLEWGNETVHDDPGVADNPGGLFDVFCRVGGASTAVSSAASTTNRSAVFVDAMMRIHSGHVIGDNLWLWRADHADLDRDEQANYPHISPIFYQTEQHEYRVETGFEVHGDDVTIFGLAVEHANGHQTVWSGERGSVYFCQCEFPYGVCQEFATKGHRGYLVEKSVTEHELFAPGIYSNFRNDAVLVTTAIEHPPHQPGIRVWHPFTVKLDNHGGILSVVNGLGDPTTEKGRPTRHIHG